MNRPFLSSLEILRSLSRAALLTAVLFTPLVAMQSVEAGSRAIIEDSRALSSGVGLVLLVSLQRS